MHCVIIFVCLFITNFLQASWAEETLAQLTLEQKIGQLFMVATSSLPEATQEILASAPYSCPYNLDPEYVQQLVEHYHIGGVIFLYRNSPQAEIALTQQLQKISSIPLLIGLDAERGLAQRHPAIPSLPYATTLAVTNNLELMYTTAHYVGQQCKKLGVHINFAPVADVNSNPHNPVIHMRSFGAYANHVADCAAAWIQGSQDAGILACAKHFPGHGDTTVDSHFSCATVDHSYEQLQSQDLVPFVRARDQHVAAIMTGHLHVPAIEHNAIPATVSSNIVTNLLRTSLQFNGLIITDALGMGGLTTLYSPEQTAREALRAGNDILLCPTEVEKCMASIKKAIESNELSIQELNEHVLRILQTKEKLGLHTQSLSSNEATIDLDLDTLATLKQQIFDQAITYLPAADTQLPSNLASTAYVQVGTSAHGTFFQELLQQQDIAVIDWQNIFSQAQQYEHFLIGVFGLTNNAQQQYGIAQELFTILQQLHKEGKKVTVILFGTVYCIHLFDANTSLLVAYEDEKEAHKTVAAIIAGTQQPQGKLPITR